jgi:hypothetical protein
MDVRVQFFQYLNTLKCVCVCMNMYITATPKEKEKTTDRIA